MSINIGIVLYVIASGFVLAGLLNALHQLAQKSHTSLSGENNDFGETQIDFNSAPPLMLKFGTTIEIIWSVVMCFLAGPYLVLIQSYRFWKTNIIPSAVFTICIFISIIWSFCSGIFVVEAGVLIGIIAL
ncbi:MAG: hypothetical protein COC00_006640 [Rhizobiales bacterium]|nr:hypothetical protein [Hyphomicrobiales bacterium]